jgi:F-type H+-transporting ATPase subunit epsilon
VITPESAVLKAEALSVVIPAHDGEIGILRDRAPLLCRLGVGIVRLETTDGPKRLFVDAGFTEVLDNQVSILTEQALTPAQIDTSAEQAALEEARRRKATTAEEHASRHRDIARAAAKIKLASSS